MALPLFLGAYWLRPKPFRRLRIKSAPGRRNATDAGGKRASMDVSVRLGGGVSGLRLRQKEWLLSGGVGVRRRAGNQRFCGGVQ